jgi:hypothetical protein
MADTTNATYDGGTDVPLGVFSTTKIGIIIETTKLFGRNLTPLAKKGRRLKILRPLCTEFLQ